MARNIRNLLVGFVVFGALFAVTEPAHAGSEKYRHLCPPGTEPFGAPPPEGKRLWCRQPVKGGGYIRQGKYAAFHPNGRKRVDGNYEGNKQHGTWTAYDRNGHKVSESVFYDGREIKKVKYDRAGKPVEVDPNAKRKEHARTRKQLNDWSGKSDRKKNKPRSPFAR